MCATVCYLFIYICGLFKDAVSSLEYTGCIWKFCKLGGEFYIAGTREGKRQQARFWSRQEGNIPVSLEEIKFKAVKWIHLTQDTVQVLQHGNESTGFMKRVVFLVQVREDHFPRMNLRHDFKLRVLYVCSDFI
jgi:hypothetical protein